MPETMVQAILPGIPLLEERHRSQNVRPLIRMEPRLPIGDRGTNVRLGAAELTFPTRRVIGRPGSQIPLPHPDIRALRRQFKPCTAFA